MNLPRLSLQTHYEIKIVQQKKNHKKSLYKKINIESWDGKKNNANSCPEPFVLAYKTCDPGHLIGSIKSKKNHET
jgi:hypothetical protein